jgi:hypothetical protein
MQSTPVPKQTDPHECAGLSAPELELVARADQRLAHAYEQIKRADEQLARVNEQITRFEHDAAREHEAARDRDRRPSQDRPALRGLIGLLLAACIFGAAFASRFYGEAAAQMISKFAPQAVLASSLPPEKPQPSAQPNPRGVQVAAADAALPQPASPAQAAPEAATPQAAPIPPELTLMLQTMERDLASQRQEIEGLKAGQAQLARESAATAEQVKANQEQVARLVATAAEQNQRAKIQAPPQRPVTTAARKPVPASPPTQARAQQHAPVQLQPAQR